MTSLGEELKRERELREISLREISEATKISMRILEAIEKNNYKMLPGGIFNRNFIRAYAEFIGLDPESAVNKYSQQSSIVPEAALPLPLAGAPLATHTQQLSRQRMLIYGIIALLIIFLLFFGLYRLSKSGDQTGRPPASSVLYSQLARTADGNV